MNTNRGTMRLLILAIVAAVAVPAAGEAVPWNAGVSYHYDVAGNIRKIGEDVHVYDVVGRLVRSKTNGVWRHYEYDAFGNRTKCTQAPGQPEQTDCQAGVSVVTGTNRVSGSGLAYDASGNLTNLAGHTYTYDAVDMIMRNDSAAGAVEYVYTADDERIAVYKAPAGSWQWTVRNLDHKPLREFTSQNGTTVGTSNWQWTKDYIWREGLLLATRQADGSTFHYHLDHLGTPRRVTDGTDYIAGYHDYKPFGLEVPDGRNETPLARTKYTGHERDVDTVSSVDSLDYMHARYYSPNLGRFLSVDPHEFWRGDMKSAGDRERILTYLRKPQNWNRYAYVMNNPVNLTDPTGETWRESFALFRDWLTGTGPEQRVFVPPSNQVADLKNAPEVNRAREFFLQKNADNIANSRPLEPVTNFKGKFGLTGLKNAGTNSTQQFVGSYSVDIRPMPNGTVRYTVTNTTSFKSLAYGIAPAWERRTYPTPGGNTSQVYTWTEPTP